jgi:glycosyltransferase involved in cell wall biosynthesis
VRVLIDYRPALRERSGVGEYTHQLVRALARQSARNGDRKLELSVFSSSWKDRLEVTPELASASLIDRRVPVRVLNFAWHRLGWPSAELLTGGAFDVTHSLHPLILPARNAAHVTTIHDLNFLRHPERTRAEVRRDYPRLAYAHARRADRILVPSEFTAGQVQQEFGVDRTKIVVGPVGAPDWQPRASRPQAGYILFLGTLEPRKNVGGLLNAYELLIRSPRAFGLPDPIAGGDTAPVPELVLAGGGTEASRVWLDRIDRDPLRKNVRHVGYVDPSRRREVYEGARVLVLPSFEEGFGIPVLEAMTLGVPVVASNRGALPEVLGDAGLLVDPESPADLARAIARMITEPAFAAACGERGTARAALFRWDITAARVYEAYRQAVEHHARRH